MSMAVSVRGEIDAAGIDGSLDEGFRLLLARRIDFGFDQQQSGLWRARLKRRIECLRGILIGDLVGIGEVASAITNGIAITRHLHLDLPKLAIPVVILWAVSKGVIVGAVFDAAAERAGQITRAEDRLASGLEGDIIHRCAQCRAVGKLLSLGVSQGVLDVARAISVASGAGAS